MSGVDIFIAILSAVMLFGGIYLNIISRRLSEKYAEEHRVQPVAQTAPGKINTKSVKK